MADHYIGAKLEDGKPTKSARSTEEINPVLFKIPD